MDIRAAGPGRGGNDPRILAGIDAHLLLQQLDERTGRAEPVHDVMPTSLVVRSSTAPLRE